METATPTSTTPTARIVLVLLIVATWATIAYGVADAILTATR